MKWLEELDILEWDGTPRPMGGAFEPKVTLQEALASQRAGWPAIFASMRA